MATATNNTQQQSGTAQTVTPVVSVLYTPKAGNTDEEYEDAYAWAMAEADAKDANGHMLGGLLTVAVSDGASSALFARDWANHLVQGFVQNPCRGGKPSPGQQVRDLARAWQAHIADGNQNLPWYAQEKMEAGSFATLLTVSLDFATNQWSARAIGDTCLFLMRRNRLKYAFPLTKSAQFGTHPALVPTSEKQPLPAFATLQTAWEVGDTLVLMTDALAHWFLTEYEQKHTPWQVLPAEPEVFALWLATLREQGAIRNDDVTLVTVRL